MADIKNKLLSQLKVSSSDTHVDKLLNWRNSVDCVLKRKASPILFVSPFEPVYLLIEDGKLTEACDLLVAYLSKRMTTERFAELLTAVISLIQQFKSASASVQSFTSKL